MLKGKHELQMTKARRKVIFHAQIGWKTPCLDVYVADTTGAQQRAGDVRGFVT